MDNLSLPDVETVACSLTDITISTERRTILISFPHTIDY